MPNPSTPNLPSPQTPYQGSAAAKQAPAPKKVTGFSIFSTVFLLGLLGLLIWFVLRLSGAQDLSGFEGREGQGELSANQDLRALLEATLKRESELTLTEAQINSYLNSTLKLQQQGMMESSMQAEGIWLDLREGEVLVLVERSWGSVDSEGAAQTMAVKLGYQIVAGQRELILGSGAWDGVFVGKQALPAGAVLLIKPSLDSLYAALEEEIKLIEKMQEVRVEEGKLFVSARKD